MKSNETTPIRFTTRAKVFAGFLGTALVVGGGAEAIHLTHQSHERARVATNETNLRSATEVLDGVISLKSGAHARISPAVKNGDNTTGDASNVGFTVPKGKIWTITRPALVKGADGTMWAIAEKPGTDPKTLEEKAKDAVYVAVEAIQTQDPSSITIEGYDKDPSDPATEATIVAVDAIEASGYLAYERSDSDQQLSYVGVSTLTADMHK